MSHSQSTSSKTFFSANEVDDGQIESKRLSHDASQAPPGALVGAPVAHSRKESRRELAERKRGEFFQRYKDAYQNWQAWHDSYWNHVDQHQAGVDPGFLDGEWDPEWSRAEFDVRHLKHAMRLSSVASVWEEMLYKALDLAATRGVEPFPWQVSWFPDVPTGYSISREGRMISSAPRIAINRWRSALPAEVASTLPRPDLESGRVEPGDAGYHPVEYPDDMDTSVDRDVEVWDSTTHIAMPEERRLIRQHEVATPPVFSYVRKWNVESDNTKVLTSHWL